MLDIFVGGIFVRKTQVHTFYTEFYVASAINNVVYMIQNCRLSHIHTQKLRKFVRDQLLIMNLYFLMYTYVLIQLQYEWLCLANNCSVKSDL